jgi:uncharacterized glyoxalase superfamily protein PhnB
MSPNITSVEIILYVRDQRRSADFYQKLLRKAPTLDVPGMTEFVLSENCTLGLMPNSGIVKILKETTPHPDLGNGIPRCELYLRVENIQQEFENAQRCGALEISPVEARDWGDTVCYFADPDGHVIAFAVKTDSEKS